MAENVRLAFMTLIAMNIVATVAILKQTTVLMFPPDSAASDPKGYTLVFFNQDESSKAQTASRARSDGETEELA